MSDCSWQSTELFETLIQQDLHEFVGESSNLINSVLLFPPLTDRFRFLIHKCVEASHFNLHSFSIGSGEGRRTIVCDSLLLVHRFKDTRYNDEWDLRKEGERLAEAARRKAIRKSELKRKAIQDMERNKKRPSQQVYIPAARRANANDCANTNIPSNSNTAGLDGVKARLEGRGRGWARPTAQIYVPGSLRRKNITTSNECDTTNTKRPEKSDVGEAFTSEMPNQIVVHSESQETDSKLNESNTAISVDVYVSEGNDNSGEEPISRALDKIVDESGEGCDTDIKSESRVIQTASGESQTKSADQAEISVDAAENSNKDAERPLETDLVSDAAARESTEDPVQISNTALPEPFETGYREDDLSINQEAPVKEEAVSREPGASPNSDSKTTNRKGKKQKNVKSCKKSKMPTLESSPNSSPSKQEKTAVLDVVNTETTASTSPSGHKKEQVEAKTPVAEPISEDAEEDSWETRFDEDGDCLDEDMMKELERAVGKVKIKKPTIDYLEYSPKDPDLEDESKYGHLIEIYDFPAEFKTADLMNIFKPTVSKDFDVKWVDDTHAIGIFGSVLAAQDALLYQHPMLSIRPISQGSRVTKLKAKHCPDYLLPSKERPTTSALTAHRLVSASLGISAPVAKEKRAKERQLLKEAKEKKRSDHTAKESAWDGTVSSSEEPPNSTNYLQTSKKKWDGSFGRCAMDDV